MILHLTPGSGTVELHIHDDAQVYLHQPITASEGPTRTGPSDGHLARRLMVLGMVGVCVLVFGFMVIRQESSPSQVAGFVPRRGDAPALARIAPSDGLPLPSSSRYGLDTPPVPFDGIPSRDNIPPAVAQQLAQPPIVTHPTAVARPAPAQPPQGGSAFGLEN